MRYKDAQKLLRTRWRYVIIFWQRKDGLDQVGSLRTTLTRNADIPQLVQCRFPAKHISTMETTESESVHVILEEGGAL
jgi:hypothetical protein